MSKKGSLFKYISQSKFMRSIFLQVLAIFLIVAVAIALIVFFSFSAEINQNIISEKQQQLAVIEDTISKRMEEITSIAYNIGRDPVFYLEPLEEDQYSGYEMSATLGRYLVGNNFIEHLAYYRLSEPDTLYTSKGELSFTTFWKSYLKLNDDAAAAIIAQIHTRRAPEVKAFSFGNGNAYFTYVCPLPQFSTNPQAFVLMMIPQSQITPLLEAQLLNSSGTVAVFSAEGEEIYRLSTLENDIPFTLEDIEALDKSMTMTVDGHKYAVQLQVSDTNGWSYVSVLSHEDMISGAASRQLWVILLLLVLMFVAIFTMLICILYQYRPISKLAGQVGEGAGGDVIDERKALSSAFATLKDDSEQKQKFETAYYEAEAANKAKSAFLSSMSHDIRTPMNAIVGMTAIAYKNADDPDQVKACLEKVQVASRYLLDIINNVLDMSRIESGRITLASETVELPKLLMSLKTILNQTVEVKHQNLVIEAESIESPFVLGDSVRLMQVFMNILSNSVKFTPEGGKITLVMRQTPETEAGFGDYEFTFTDTGIGMSPEFVSKVFDTFSRAEDNGTSKVEGTGLGMAIAKNLVELMGGAIVCESTLGVGTTFTVKLHLPLADERSAKGESVEAEAECADVGVPNLTGRHILLVEDNLMNRELALRIISETGAEVTEAGDGQQAVDAFVNSPEGFFDVILMDLQMPVMNGYESTAAIRTSKRSDAKTVPIYAMTANTFDEDVRQVKEGGMDGHIGKPYTPEDLYKTLRKAMLK